MVPRLGEWKGQTQGWGLWIDQDSHREEDASAVHQAVPQNGGQGVFKTHQSPKENQNKNFYKNFVSSAYEKCLTPRQIYMSSHNE